MGGDQSGEHHGRKRQAEDDTDVQQGISTQFKKLRISANRSLPFGTAIYHTADHAPMRAYASLPTASDQAAFTADFMPVDETKDRIVIYDLEAEIAEIEAAEPPTLFLPDIDKKVSAIPQMLLQNQNKSPNTQLVLYREPSSISVPKEEDAVRKAIIAARARAREKQAYEIANVYETSPIISDAKVPSTPDTTYDPDAMDIG